MTWGLLGQAGSVLGFCCVLNLPVGDVWSRRVRDGDHKFVWSRKYGNAGPSYSSRKGG